MREGAYGMFNKAVASGIVDREKRAKIFSKATFYFSNNVKPGVSEFKRLIESAGGQVCSGVWALSKFPSLIGICLGPAAAKLSKTRYGQWT